MKKITKAISLVLLLALVVSVLAVFPAFAADTEADTDGIRTLMDFEEYFDSKKGTEGYVYNKSASNTGFVDNGLKYPNIQETTREDGERTFAFGFYGMGADTPFSDDYHGTKSSTYIKIPVADNFVQANGDNAKDTDFIVIDFDVAVEYAMLDQLFITLDWAEISGSSVDDFEYIRMSISPDGENFGVQSRGATRYTKTDSDGWANVTVIYDFSTNGASMGTYIYIDGVLAGIGRVPTTETIGLKNIILCAIATPGAKQSTPGESVILSNFTVKAFEAGYKGELAEISKAGKFSLNPGAEVAPTLHAVPQLAYCLANEPAPYKVADVERADGSSFTAYSVGELDANLKDGDKVTLYREIQKTLLVDLGANITWEGPAAKPTVFEIDYEAYDWVVRGKSGAPIDSTLAVGAGKQVYSQELGGEVGIEDVTLVEDTLSIYLDQTFYRSSSNWTKSYRNQSYVTVFRDIQTAGKGNTAKEHVVRIHTTYDLNGFKWYYKTNSTNALYLEAGDFLGVKNGTLEYALGSADILMTGNNNRGVVTIFEDLHFVHARAGTTGANYRCSHVIFINCKVDGGVDADGNRLGANGQLTNVRAHGGKYVVSAFVNCDVKMKDSGTTSPSVVDIDNPPSYSDGVGIASFIDTNVEAYYLVTATKTKASTISPFRSDIVVYDSKIKTTSQDAGAIFAPSITTVYAATEDSRDIYDVDIYIDNSELVAPNVISVSLDKGIKTLVDGKDFSFDIDCYITDSKINTLENQLITGADAIYTGSINLDGDVYLTSAQTGTTAESITYKGEAYSADNANVALVHSSANAGYGYKLCLADERETVSYVAADGTTDSIEWAKGESEVVDISVVSKLPDPVGKYDAYKWEKGADGVYAPAIVPNFKVQANLTLHKDISLNLFLAFLEGEGLVDTEAVQFTVDGADDYVVTEYNGKTKIQIKGITPADIDKVFTVSVVVNGVEGMKPAEKSIKISVKDYCEKVRDDGVNEKTTNLMNAILAYGEAFDKAPVGDGVIAEGQYGTANKPEKSETFEEVSLNLDAGFIWSIKVNGAHRVEATYSYDGVVATRKLDIKGNSVNIHLKAFDLIDNITVVAYDDEGNKVGETDFNFGYYAEGVIKTDNSYESILDAIYGYALAAKNYKNPKAA